jgi:prepilin-type N-terminal cleavage/methylation domain-containing protein
MVKAYQELHSQLKDHRGFTLLELCIILAIIGILATLASYNYMSIKKRAYDTAAHSDSRSLADVALNNFLDRASVRYNVAGSSIGTQDLAGNARNPVFMLSPAVAIRITAASSTQFVAGKGYFEAWLYNLGGSSDPLTPSGKREFYVIVDEVNDLISIPSL